MTNSASECPAVAHKVSSHLVNPRRYLHKLVQMKDCRLLRDLNLDISKPPMDFCKRAFLLTP